MLSLYLNLEDLHPEKYADKEEVPVTFVDWGRQMRPLTAPIVYSDFFPYVLADTYLPWEAHKTG